MSSVHFQEACKNANPHYYSDYVYGGTNLKKLSIVFAILAASVLSADIMKDAQRHVPKGWSVDEESVATGDFNSDGLEDAALCYYKVDPELGEIENRTNRVLVLLGGKKGLERVVDQLLPDESDYGTPVEIEFNEGTLIIFQHRGIMNQWNEWDLCWDSEKRGFFVCSNACGGIAGLGSATSFDFQTGTGHVEKIWDDIEVSAEYATIYADRAGGVVDLDGADDEDAWKGARTLDTCWITYGRNSWEGEGDAWMSVRSLYDDDNLYLFVEITDDSYIKPSKAEDLMASDHLELWIDKLTTLAREADEYYPEEWDRVKDPYVSQIALAEVAAAKPMLERWLPDNSDPRVFVKAGFSKSKKGINVELAIPWSEFGYEYSPAYASFSLVYSDSDNKSKPKQETLLGTSRLQWADPFTFGIISTSRPQRTYWGLESF